MTKTVRMRSLLTIILALATALLDAGDAPSKVSLPDNAPPCVRWAANEVERALAARGYGGAGIGTTIRVASFSATGNAPESYRIVRGGDGTLVLSGADANGTMYALLDLAEQFANAPPGADWGTAQYRIALRQAKPHVRWRGLNLFVHVMPSKRLAGWFHDAVFWERLLDLMARSRFNWIDLHGAYNPHSTIFSNVLPHFTSIGAPNETADRNRAMLKRVIEMAAARGIRVALMNYDDRDPTGGEREDWTKATAKRIGQLVRDCPDLWMVGSRVKRSGSNIVDRFSDAYVKPARRAGFKGPMHTRSWGTDRWTAEHIVEKTGKPFFVEVKYNGEQLGTPYPALQGWGEDYAYEDFLNPPRDFGVIWQVRANGTCRIFPWADAGFVRIAAQSFTLGGAAGFSIEPHWAYFLPDPARRYRDPTGALAEGERYLFERDWAWYFYWGRLTYDPTTPAPVFLHPWLKRYGHRAGDAAARTLMYMSRIVTTLYTAQAYGVDHRDAAPEMEIGILNKKRDHWRSLDELCDIAPLDRARGCSPSEFAEAAAGRKQEPRLTPIDFATELEHLAAETQAAADELTAMLSEARNAPAAGTLALEARTVAGLGLAGASRLRGLTAFAFYRQTTDPRWLNKANVELNRATTRWMAMADTADKLYLPVQDPLRAGRDFTWRSVRAHHQRLLVEIHSLVERARKDDAKLTGTPKLAHVYLRPRAAFGDPDVTLRRKKDDKLHVSVRFPAGAPRPDNLRVLHKPLDSRMSWSTTSMEHRSGVFSVELRNSPGGLLLQFQATDKEQRGWLWPDAKRTLPFIWSEQATSF